MGDFLLFIVMSLGVISLMFYPILLFLGFADGEKLNSKQMLFLIICAPFFAGFNLDMIARIIAVDIPIVWSFAFFGLSLLPFMAFYIYGLRKSYPYEYSFNQLDIKVINTLYDIAGYLLFGFMVARLFDAIYLRENYWLFVALPFGALTLYGWGAIIEEHANKSNQQDISAPTLPPEEQPQSNLIENYGDDHPLKLDPRGAFKKPDRG